MLLAIETSCDETAVAVSENGKVVWEEVYSQIKLHSEYGGVVPELASREHLQRLPRLYDLAQKEFGNFDAVAASVGPGLKGCLLVGSMFGQALARGFGVPFIPINHLEGHLYSGLLEEGAEYEYPLMGMIVSGGHSEIVLAKSFRDYERVCFTRDDAAGEAFDKVAKLLGLGYPGGPEVSKRAAEGNPEKYEMPIGMAAEEDALSFSGLKTWISQHVQKNGSDDTADLCASFEKTVVDTLCLKLDQAVKRYKPKTLVLAGGVACNRRLRTEVKKRYPETIIPAPRYCTDNASMIAVVGELARNSEVQFNRLVKPRWPL